MGSRNEIKEKNNFLGRVCPAFCCVYSEPFWADCFRVPGSDFSQRDYTILSRGLVLDKMMKKAFCRRIMGSDRTTEFAGFSVPGGGGLIPPPLFFFYSFFFSWHTGYAGGCSDD